MEHDQRVDSVLGSIGRHQMAGKAEGTRWSCSRFQAGDVTFFVSVAQHSAPEVGGGEGPADLAVTDGGAAWTAQGVTSGSLAGAHPKDRSSLAHLLAALSELEQTALQYTHRVKHEAGGGLTLMVEWQPPGQAAGLKLQVRASLAPAVPAQPVVAAILSLSLDNLAAAAATASGALQQSEEYGKELTRCQDIVEKYVNSKAAQERETNAKVAALLNSKKKKLRELQTELEVAQEEIKRLQAGGAAMDVDGGAGSQPASSHGGAGSSRQPRGGGGGRRGRGRQQQVVDSSESEDEASEREQTPERG